LNLYLDANVLVDVVLRRIDEKGTRLWLASTLTLDDIHKGKNRGSTSVLSMYVVYVLVNPRDTKSGDLLAREKLRSLRSFLTTVDLTDNIVEESLKENRLMVEDAIQFITAKKIGAEAIVTRNIRHFSKVKDEIKIVTPEELVAQ